MLEVEQKYRVVDTSDFARRLSSVGAQPSPAESHADTYYRHPCRNFVETGEAFRVRRINDVAFVTYKGKKLAVGDDTLKAREEIEWCLAPEDAEGVKMESLLIALGFESVTTVRKRRVSFRWPEDHANADTTVTLDEVDQVGSFAEIEQLVDDAAAESMDRTAAEIAALATQLGLTDRVKESYLEMLLNALEP